jgi:glutaredoxin-dependent peroxiredoxin
MNIQKGDNAPLFTLPDSDKKLVNLTDFKGKNVVLLFFPFAYTGVCTTELCGVRDHLHDYTDLNAEILAISVDSPFSLHHWKTEQQFNFTLLSDFNKTASTAYGSLYETFSVGLHGVSKRSAFVIDGNGIVQYAEVLEHAGEIPNLDAVKETLKSLN